MKLGSKCVGHDVFIRPSLRVPAEQIIDRVNVADGIGLNELRLLAQFKGHPIDMDLRLSQFNLRILGMPGRWVAGARAR